MIPQLITMMLVTVLNGCSSHERLYFVEESHIGLKAKAAVDGTPGEVDFGYRRSIMTLIPKANAGKSDEEKKKIETDQRLSFPASTLTCKSPSQLLRITRCCCIG